jgi:hypothetical protein
MEEEEERKKDIKLVELESDNQFKGKWDEY